MLANLRRNRNVLPPSTRYTTKIPTRIMSAEEIDLYLCGMLPGCRSSDVQLIVAANVTISNYVSMQ